MLAVGAGALRIISYAETCKATSATSPQAALHTGHIQHQVTGGHSAQ